MKIKKIKKERWKNTHLPHLKGYYKISNKGNVKSLARTIARSRKGKGKKRINDTAKLSEKILIPTMNGRGYLQVILSKNNKKHTLTVHQLVARAFIKNPKNKPTVNHKNNNKLINEDWNLEWATRSEQILHSIKMGQRKHRRVSKKVNVSQYSLKKKFIKNFESYTKAAKAVGVSRQMITSAVAKKRKTAAGFIWEKSRNKKKT